MDQKKLKNPYGFTLIELLIVIVILAILSTIGALYYGNISVRARDSARRTDIYEISTVLEANKTLQGYVPLQVNQFSSFQWSDPQGDAYCIAVGNPADPTDTVSWGNTCPGNFIAVAPGVPSGSFTEWKICTFLENSSLPLPNVFCKIFRQ